MSLIRTIRCASAPLDQRLTVGDGQTMLVHAKTGLRSPRLPLGAHPLSCPIGAIPVARRAPDPIRAVAITQTNNGLHSNPHSHTPLLTSCQTARGFLPRGLSNAYRRPR
jgi:hypothetical protein